MELALQIQELTAHLPSLPNTRLDFALSLVNTFARKGALSPSQTPWVSRLIAVAKGEDAPAAITVGDLTGLLDLFKTAKLKHPKIRLQVATSDSTTAIVLSVAGARSKAPGSVNVAGAGTFGARDWFGRISPEGRFEPSRSTAPWFVTALAPILRELATDPVAAIKRYGTLTGSCMFCGLTLSGEDGRSKAAGMGEKCAKNYGLHAQWKSAK